MKLFSFIFYPSWLGCVHFSLENGGIECNDFFFCCCCLVCSVIVIFYLVGHRLVRFVVFFSLSRFSCA